MTVTGTPVAMPVTAHPDSVVVVPTRSELNADAETEYGWSTQAADEFLSFIERSVERSRSRGYRPARIPRKSADYRKFHGMLSQAVPANTTALPGSYREKLKSFVLDASLGEIGLLHSTDNGECALFIHVGRL